MAKGVRRVTAVTGREAVATVQRMAASGRRSDGAFQLQARKTCRRASRRLQEEIKKLQQQAQERRGQRPGMAPPTSCLAGATEVGGAKVIVGEMPAGP